MTLFCSANRQCQCWHTCVPLEFEHTNTHTLTHTPIWRAAWAEHIHIYISVEPCCVCHSISLYHWCRTGPTQSSGSDLPLCTHLCPGVSMVGTDYELKGSIKGERELSVGHTCKHQLCQSGGETVCPRLSLAAVRLPQF